jgi:hypothetical protein
MISELTEKQKNKLIDYGLKWTKIGLSTEPVDIEKAQMAICKAYHYAGLKPPTIQVGPFNNPLDCAKAQVVVKNLPKDTNLKDLKEFEILPGQEFDPEEIVKALDEQIYGFNEASWLGYYEFLQNEFDVIEIESFRGLMELSKHIGWWAPYDKCAFIQERPLEIHFDEKGELHNEHGPAIKWRGEDRSMDVYVIHGELQPPPE